MTKLNVSSNINVEKSILSHVKYEHLIAGVLGGLTSTMILHPLDLLKVRFAVNDGRHIATPTYKGITNAVVTIFRHEGLYGLYRGVTPNLWGAGSSWGFYFLFYNAIKTRIQGGNMQTPLGAHMHLLAASEAGVLTLLITNPLWVIKTRLCLQYNNSVVATNAVVYDGMVDALRKIYRLEGLRGYYKGLGAGIFGVSHGAVQFTAYEEMKNRYYQYKNIPLTTKLGTVENLSFAAVSKLIAVAFTYPYQVVRTRLQNQHYSYRNSWECIKLTWQYEGWKGFYNGLGTNLLRVIPATMITFVTYENVSHFLISKRS